MLRRYNFEAVIFNDDTLTACNNNLAIGSMFLMFHSCIYVTKKWWTAQCSTYTTASSRGNKQVKKICALPFPAPVIDGGYCLVAFSHSHVIAF